MPTRLTGAFGIEHPIVCAPMALVTGGDGGQSGDDGPAAVPSSRHPAMV
jgi:hypothetical protein